MSCLFDSLSYFTLNDNGHSLRQKITAYINEDPILIQPNTRLSNILQIQDVGFQNYVNSMRSANTWGGAIEIKAFCETRFPEIWGGIKLSVPVSQHAGTGRTDQHAPSAALATQIGMLQVLHWQHRTACSDCCTGHTDQHAPTAALATRISMFEMHCCSTLKRWSAHNAVAF